MCPPRRPRIVQASPAPAPSPAPRQSKVDTKTYSGQIARVRKTPAPRQAVTPPPKEPAPTEPAPKMRTINRTSSGATISGQQTTSTAAPSRRKRQSARMGRRAGTGSLRISRSPNTGQGDLLY